MRCSDCPIALGTNHEVKRKICPLAPSGGRVKDYAQECDCDKLKPIFDKLKPLEDAR